MIGEAIAYDNAKKLESIILDSINGSDWTDIRSEVKGFSKKNLYNWYLNECNEGFTEPNPLIVKTFTNE